MQVERRWLGAVVVVLAVLGSTSVVRAQTGDEPVTASMIRDAGVHRRPVDLSILAGAPGFGLAGFGGGVRIGIPLLHDGFLPNLNESVFFETGAEFVHWNYLSSNEFNSVTVPIHMRWNFYLARDWTAFGAVGFELSYFLGESLFGSPRNVPFFNVAQGGVLTLGIGGGVLYNFSEATSLRIDATLSLLGIGLTFRF